MSAALIDLADWVRTPYLEPAELGLGLFGIVVIALFGVLATWAVRAPGAVVESERRRARGLGSAVGRLELAFVRGAPWVIVASIALTLFPIDGASTLVLSSRSRSDVAESTEGRWAALLQARDEEEWSAPDGFLDVGPVVDAALAAIAERTSDRGLRRDDVELLDEIGRIVRDTLVEASVTPVSLESLHQVSHRTAPGLPRWLIESVERAVLKGQTQRVHTKRVVVFREDRQTAVGNAWDGIAQYLRSDAGRFRAPEISLLPAGAASASERPVRLVEASGPLRKEGGETRLKVRLRVGEYPGAGPAIVDYGIRLVRGGRSFDVTAKVDLRALARFETVDLTFPGSAFGSDATVSQLVHGMPIDAKAVPGAGDGVLTSWSKRILFLGPDSTALLAEAEQRRTSPDHEAWRRRMDERGTPFRDLSLASGRGSAEAGDVLMDTGAEPGGVWVYVHGIRPETEGRSPAIPPRVGTPLAPTGFVETRTGSHVRPGVDSLRRVALREPMLGVSAPALEDVAFVREIGQLLYDGLRLRSRSKEVPWVSRFSLPTFNRPPTTATFFGAPSAWLTDASGALLDPEERDALWSAVVEASYLAADSAREGSSRIEGVGGHPVMLLDPSDVRFVRGAALRSSLVALLVGVALYAFVVFRGVLRSHIPPASRG